MDPKMLHGPMCFVGTTAAGEFVLGTRCGAKFCFHQMCLYPKCSDFSREFKNDKATSCFCWAPSARGKDKLNTVASLSFFFNSHTAVWPLQLRTATGF